MSALLQAILFCCGLLAVGLTLRATIGVLRKLYIPAAVVAGVIGFLAVQIAVRSPDLRDRITPVVTEMSGWPSVLIAVVFAGLLLEKSSGATFGEALRRGTRSAILAWIIILGQIGIGLLVYMTLVRPADPLVPASFGQLLEASWAGGHAVSTQMGQVYTSQGFPEGMDVALFLATVGLVWGVGSGLVLVNLAIRRGWTSAGSISGPIRTVTGLEHRRERVPISFAKTRADVLEPMTLQIVILAAAFGAGWMMQGLFIKLTAALLGERSEYLRFLGNVPLFLFTLLGGLVVRTLMTTVRIDDLIDGASMQRLVGVSMEFLIVAAISSMRVEALSKFVLPIVALVALAAGWCAFCLLVLARRLLPPKYWFELGLLNYGFSTANTPQGMMLLRIVDPDLKTGAAEDYAVAAPLSAPFVGGGVITFVLMPLLLQKVAVIWVVLTLAAAILGLVALGRRLAR
jgi:ESS family glutamate:Na+ symporter